MRDLHWVLTSPHLLAPNTIVPTLPDEQAARIAARSHSWLAALDADPSPLLEFLQSQRNVRRLGFYFELVATLLLPALSFCVVSLIALQPSP